MKLYDHQKKALADTKNQNHVAYYHDMGLGKTFTGSEKMRQLNAQVNLVICQKSKIDDWIEHFKQNYWPKVIAYNLTTDVDLFEFCSINKNGIKSYSGYKSKGVIEQIVGIINYDLIWRRKELLSLKDFTLLLDESSLIQNEKAKRTKFIMSMRPKNVILLSGTPTGGKYERLLTQMNLLGWKISEKVFWNQYVNWEWNETQDGFWQKKILGYKNEERLKRKMRQHGCDFLKTEEVFDLPEQINQKIYVLATKEYLMFKKNSYVSAFDQEFVGDTILNKMLYERQLCAEYNENKLTAFQDLVESTEDRLIVFYNFNNELNKIWKITDEINKPVSIVNGEIKQLDHYEKYNNSVTFIQYQAGAMGLNLQLANKIIYFSPPLSSELFEQSKKRIHRIGQNKSCFYYYLVCKNSIEERIYKTLSKRNDYTERLFEKDVTDDNN